VSAAEPHVLHLRCWVCGTQQGVEVSHPPRFGFELAQIALAVDWRAIQDLDRSRILIFCTPACEGLALTKDNRVRLRPPAIGAKLARARLFNLAMEAGFPVPQEVL